MTRSVRPLAFLALLGAAFTSFECSGGDGVLAIGGPPTSPAPTQNSVIVGDNFFNPATITIAAAESVTWTWSGINPHDIVFDAGGASSGVQTTGTFQRSFPDAGTLTYFCSVHGRSIMSGTVTVQ